MDTVVGTACYACGNSVLLYVRFTIYKKCLEKAFDQSRSIMSRAEDSIYQLRTQTGGLVFDPRTKILLLVELNIILFMGQSLLYEICVLLFCAFILLIGGQNRSAWKFSFVFTVFVALQYVTKSYTDGFFFSLVYFVTVVARKFLPCIMLGKWILATTDVSAFVAAMWKIRVPKDVIVTTSVVFRCFPTIREEWGAIQTAMKMRGIEFSLKHMAIMPVRTMEHLFVPLFISVLNISDELAAAALCRGLDNPGKHTCMFQIRFHWHDILIMIFSSLWLIAVCAVRIRGYSL